MIIQVKTEESLGRSRSGTRDEVFLLLSWHEVIYNQDPEQVKKYTYYEATSLSHEDSVAKIENELASEQAQRARVERMNLMNQLNDVCRALHIPTPEVPDV